jgi:transposase
VVFNEYLRDIERIEEAVKRLEGEIHEQSQGSVHAPVIKALQVLRGIKEVAAATIAAEVGVSQGLVTPGN